MEPTYERNVQIIHFHKAPGKRIVSWADVSSDEEERESPKTNHNKVAAIKDATNLEGRAHEPERDERTEQAGSSQEPVADDKTEQVQQLLNDLLAEGHGVSEEGGQSQELALEGPKVSQELGLEAPRAEDPLEVDPQEPAAGENEVWAMREEILEFLKAVRATSRRSVTIHDSNHLLDAACTRFIQDKLPSKYDDEKQPIGPGVPSSTGARRAGQSSKSAKPVAAHQASDAPRELRLADLLPPPPASHRRTRGSKKIQPQFAAAFIVCSGYDCQHEAAPAQLPAPM